MITISVAAIGYFFLKFVLAVALSVIPSLFAICPSNDVDVKRPGRRVLIIFAIIASFVFFGPTLFTFVA